MTRIINEPQGSPAWLAHRARSFNASDIGAAMGLSSHKTRSQLLHELATGILPEIDDATQARFDRGHEYEAIARPWAEEIIGEELFPVVLAADPDEFDGLPLSASLDGQTMAGDPIFEHKSLNDELRESLPKGEIPEEYHPQMEQGLMLSGATRCLLMASSGVRDDMLYAWYESRPEMRQRVLDTWAQIQRDLETYEPPEAEAPKPVGRTPENLPALHIELKGAVTASNLNAYRDHALAVIQGINTDLQTDQDFADAESTVKFCKTVEERLDAAKQHALSQTADIDLLFRTIDEISAEARAKRLELDKLVKSRKAAIRDEILLEARRKWSDHITQINATLGKLRLPEPDVDFAGAMKGKRTVASLRDAADTELAIAKIEANARADRMRANLEILRSESAGYETLFSDAQALVQKDPDDLRAQIKTRISEHKEAEQKRLDAEREQIRAEEQARAQREVEAKAAAEREASKPPEPTPAPKPAGPTAQELRESAAKTRERAQYAERNSDRRAEMAQADRIDARAAELETAEAGRPHLMVELGEWQKGHGISNEAFDHLITILRNHTAALDMAA